MFLEWLVAGTALGILVCVVAIENFITHRIPGEKAHPILIAGGILFCCLLILEYLRGATTLVGNFFSSLDQNRYIQITNFLNGYLSTINFSFASFFIVLLVNSSNKILSSSLAETIILRFTMISSAIVFIVYYYFSGYVDSYKQGEFGLAHGFFVSSSALYILYVSKILKNKEFCLLSTNNPCTDEAGKTP